MLKKPSTYIALLIIAGLAVIGGFINKQRELSSVCGQSRYVDFIRPEMINAGPGKGYVHQSIYYGALKAALSSDRLEEGRRPELEAEMQQINEDMENAKVFAREVSPSSSTELICLYELKIGPSKMRTRFKLVLQDMPGTEFAKNFKKRQRSLFLLEELQPGVPVETVRVAKLGLRQHKIQEPKFRGGRFDYSYTPDVLLREGVISEIPK